MALPIQGHFPFVCVAILRLVQPTGVPSRYRKSGVGHVLAFLMTGFLPLRSTLKAGLSGSPFLVMVFPLDSMDAFSVCFSVT